MVHLNLSVSTILPDDLDRNRLKRWAAIDGYARAVNRVAAAAGHFPKPVVVDRAARAAVVVPV